MSNSNQGSVYSFYAFCFILPPSLAQIGVSYTQKKDPLLLESLKVPSRISEINIGAALKSTEIRGEESALMKTKLFSL